ncbi:MAG: hypothetical protein H0U03_04210 [Actinobacteria bacterium]|nr:hypothetical protein [Actinomycetota bacterium]
MLGNSEAAAREEAMRDISLAGRGLRDSRQRQVRAAIGLALAFPTWQRLTTTRA